ncbi:UDP-N-acetylglucosamine 3-dehydrogenase [Arthrobacter pascens]|jgi:UDP-N-acetylglucosamine 3-dehydrogenase|uniref:Gfo/Idh/MocA family protein n=1 Tax=Arthrobacter pascens TaxID=1677 RepID=UPI002786B11D|nr:Gfo/Idh/MocA family oxidoreductase [Arthrobacter pascens]MDQ0633317.1 UDP-N-acetylglucosamine 3-dehydrogenase [Arthrobacter pascens]
MANLRAGLVGLGMMGRHHARVIRELEGVDLVAVADSFGDQHGAADGLKVCGSVDDLIAQGIDIAVVAVPTNLHEEVAMQLAAAGIHCLVEKPIAADSESGGRIAAEFERRGLIGAVGHIERFNPALQSLRKRLESGDLGDVYHISTRRQGPFPSRIADVGVVKDLATHDIDLTAWLAQSNYVDVMAHTTSRSGREHEDMVTAIGHLGGGIVTNHIVNWLSPMKERTAIVLGERGAFVADTISADLTFVENGTFQTEWESMAAFRGVSEGSSTRFALAKREPLKMEHEAFRDAVLGKSMNIVTMAEGLETLRVAEAVLESARTGAVVTLQVPEREPRRQ